MALTNHQCLSCGKDTPLDPSLPAAEQFCVHCGHPCDDDGLGDEGEGKPVKISEERIAELRASGYQPQERSVMNCPRCKAMTPVVEGQPLHKQRCSECGIVLGEKPGKVRRRKKSRSMADGVLKRRSRERVWMPMLGAALIMVMAGIFWQWMKTRPAPDRAGLQPPPPSPPRVSVRDLVAKFMAARMPEEVLPLIRKPAAFEKPLREWCAAHPGTLPLNGNLLVITPPREALGARLMNATVLLKGVSKVNLLAVETPGGWKLEWPAFSGIADLSVEDFLKKKPGAPVTVFLNVRRSDYYNNAYADSGVWQALHVSDRQEEHAFFAYAARKDAALMNALGVLPLEETPARGQATVDASRRLALRVHFGQPAGEGAPQVEVASVEGDGWYIP